MFVFFLNIQFTFNEIAQKAVETYFKMHLLAKMHGQQIGLKQTG